MRIFKFLLLILLIAPINAFGACSGYGADDCNDHSNEGCYWYQGGGGGFIVAPDECKTCEAGWYITDDYKCESCPKGYYCTGNGQKTPCPAGTYSDKEGLTAEGECTPCPAGTYNGIPGRDSKCVESCTRPSLPNDDLLCKKYSFKFTSGGDSANSCQWSFGYDVDSDVYPVCDKNGNKCYCVSCGAPYEVSSAMKTIIFDGERAGFDPSSVKVCPKFSPLELRSNPDSRPYEPVGDVKDFVFYAIIKDEQVFISATNDPDPENYGTRIEIQNVALKNGLNYDVILSIGDCEFETIGCGSYHSSTCSIIVDGSCSADDLGKEADVSTEMMLDTKWVLDVPVLIATDKLVFDDPDGDYKLHIKYSVDDNKCFRWAKNIEKVNGIPEHLDVGECVDNEQDITAVLDGYNKRDGSMPFLGYTIGCWKREEDDLNSSYIMLEEDFLESKYPNDCSTLSVLTTDPGEVASSLASMGDKIWPGITQYYNFANITKALANTNTSNLDQRCFIVGLYGYPPCTPGCYCPDGKSTACADSPSPFYSNRGSVKRSNCYLRSDVVFKEEGREVTERVEELLGLPKESYETIKLEQKQE